MTASSIRKIVETENAFDHESVRQYLLILAFLGNWNDKKITKHLDNQLQRHPELSKVQARMLCKHGMWRIVTIDAKGKHRDFLFSYNYYFEMEEFISHNDGAGLCTCYNEGAKERIAAREAVLAGNACQEVAKLVKAYEKARDALRVWEKENFKTFPDKNSIPSIREV